MNSPSTDLMMMERAFQLSKQARLISPPNPWVGSVITNNGQIVGEGYTQPPGSAHAEVVALSQAAGRAKGGTLYCTLEPCSHFGRTPPCVNAIIKAGISRVVIGIQDPDKQVQGQGIATLRAANIEVVTGLYADSISELLAPYLHHRRTGRPYCLLKAATSIDGRIAAQDGSSQWITSSKSRLDSFQLRAESQAILIGAGTARADLPSLTVRDIPQLPLSPPLRVVLDPKGTLQPQGPLFDVSLAPTLIVTTASCPGRVKEAWQQYGVQVETVATGQNPVGLDLDEILVLLGKRGILQVMVEGGSHVLGAFLEERRFQHLVVYIGGRILGSDALPLFTTQSIVSLQEAPELILVGVTPLDNDIRLDYLFESVDAKVCFGSGV